MPSIPLMGKSSRGGSTPRKGGKRPAARKPAKNKPTPKPAPRRELEQRHLDLIGLALLGLGLYLGFVLYAGWDGGSAGSGIEVALTWTVGAVAYALPMLLAGIGLALVVRPLISYPGAINAGALLLVAGLLLAFAAGTAGLGPDTPVRGDGFFEPGSAEIASGVRTLLPRIAQALADLPGQVLITGHTDNQPIRSLRFPSNWHLSQERADAVKTELAKTVKRERLRSEGRADSEPLTENNTPAGRARNRRVEITLFVAGGGA